MELFSGIMVFIVFFSIIIFVKNPKKKILYSRVYMVSTFLLLLIISGCRGLNVGTDTKMFVRAFKRVDSFSDAFRLYVDRFELGYRIFNAGLKQISDSPHILLFMSSLITLYLFYFFFYKKSKYPFLSIIFFVALMYYCNSMCLLRQYLAMAICCLAIMKLCDKKRLLFVALVMLATLFHSSSLIVIVLLPLERFKITSQNKLKLILASMAVVVFSNQLIAVLIKLLPQYTSYLSSEKYYLDNQLGSILKAGLQGIMFFLINLYFKPDEDNESIDKIGYLCSLIAFCIGVVSIKGAVLERMGFYFSVVNCVTIPNMIYNIKSKRDKYIITFLLLIICLLYYFLILFLRPYWSGVVPYIFWD